VFFATYTPPQKTDCTLFAACGRQTLRGFFALFCGYAAPNHLIKTAL